MARPDRKIDLPVSQVRRYLEPGPIVLVTSALGDARNIMTMGWHTVMEFAPSLVGCVIAGRNHSFELIRRSRECVINVPTTALTYKVVGIGNSTGAEIDKFAEFALTPQKAQRVRAAHPRVSCQLRVQARRRHAHREVQLLHIRGAEGARGAVAEASRDAALHRQRHIHGLGQDHQPARHVQAGLAGGLTGRLQLTETSSNDRSRLPRRSRRLPRARACRRGIARVQRHDRAWACRSWHRPTTRYRWRRS
jgi:flavin reductase (DIM6/NTAB) family NADH-FMN oxidoreductase RutF